MVNRNEGNSVLLPVGRSKLKHSLVDQDIFFISVTVVDSNVENSHFLHFLQVEFFGPEVSDHILALHEVLQTTCFFQRGYLLLIIRMIDLNQKGGWNAVEIMGIQKESQLFSSGTFA